MRFGGEGLQRSVVDCSWLVLLLLRFELNELATEATAADVAAAVVLLVAFVVADDVEEAALLGVVAAVAIDGAADADAAAAAAEAADCCVEAQILDADVEGPESVASTGLSHELLLLQGCEWGRNRSGSRSGSRGVVF